MKEENKRPYTYMSFHLWCKPALTTHYNSMNTVVVVVLPGNHHQNYQDSRCPALVEAQFAFARSIHHAFFFHMHLTLFERTRNPMIREFSRYPRNFAYLISLLFRVSITTYERQIIFQDNLFKSMSYHRFTFIGIFKASIDLFQNFG